MLLDSTIESLQRDIIAIYEDQLRLHHLNVRNLQRGRRSTGSPDIPYLGEGYWHSYYYDLDVNNRESMDCLDDEILVSGAIWFSLNLSWRIYKYV